MDLLKNIKEPGNGNVLLPLEYKIYLFGVTKYRETIKILVFLITQTNVTENKDDQERGP